jgi:hypothetical protein
MKRTSGKKRRWVYLSISIGLMLVFAMYFFETARAEESCANCGAIRILKSWSFIRFRAGTTQSIRNGWVSNCIQKVLGGCNHDWELCDESRKSLLCRSAGSGRGLARRKYVAVMESFSPAGELICERITANAQFRKQFIESMHDANGLSSREFFNKLIDELMD